MLSTNMLTKYDKINFLYRDEKGIHSPYMYFRGLKTALQRNGLLYYAYNVYSNEQVNLKELLKYPILCITGSHEPIFEVVQAVNNKQFMAEINPESLYLRDGSEPDYSCMVKERSGNFDIYFSGSEVDLHSYWGKPCYWLPSWVHTEILDDIVPAVSGQIGFIGLAYRRNDFFSQDRNGIVSAVNSVPKDDARENVVELCKLINNFKMLVNSLSSVTASMTGKTLEYMACKRLSLCQFDKTTMFKMKMLFEDGKDIVFFKTFEEMEDKYNYYINNEKTRAKIALAGYKKVRRFHNADLRARRLAQIVLHHANGGKFMPEFNDINRFNNTKESKLFPVSCMCVNDQLYQAVPHMHEYEPEVISCCFDLFDQPIRVLEWGSGNSTLYFSKYLQDGSEWDSIEHNSRWAKLGVKLLEEYRNRNIRIHFAPCNKDYQEGVEDGDLETFRDYVLFPTTLKKNFQIVMVDGRARVECMKVGWYLLEKNGVMILHDAQRKEYQDCIPKDSYYLRVVNSKIIIEGHIAILFIGKSAEVISKIKKSLVKVLPQHITIDSNIDNFYVSNVPIQASESPATSPGLKFLQIHTFYPQYLKDFYLKNSSLTTASYKDQIEALNRDGFSSIHIFAPYMNALNFESQLIIANNPYSQQQWMHEKKLQFGNDNTGMWQIVREQVDRIKPEILYLTDPITFDSKFIRSLSCKPKLVLGWRAANIPQQTDWARFDVILSSLSKLRNAAQDLGARATEHFYPGYPDGMNTEIQTVSPQYDVVFSGTWSKNQHRLRNEHIKAIAAEASAGRNQYSCAFYLNGQKELIPAQVERFNYGPRFGRSMYKALRSGRIVIDARATHEIADHNGRRIVDLAGNETANMRMFEVTGCGSFLLTEYYENLREYFKLGVEIETFRNREELIDKIHYYLANPEKREKIAKNGQQRCLDQYTMKKRAVDLDRIIRKHLGSKLLPQVLERNPAYEIKQRSEKLLENDKYSEAFKLIIKAKSLKVPVKGLDYLRAMCFVRMNNFGNALEALREELRLFPENREATLLYDKLSDLVASADFVIDDSEFNDVLKVVKPYTLLSARRLYSLFNLTKQVCDSDLPGNFVECGVAAGGSTALLAYMIKSRSKRLRKIYAFDSFEGMPAPTAADTHQGIPAEDTGWGSGTCYATETSVREICRALNVSDIVEPVKGYFQETLPHTKNQIGPVALLHMDGDWYDSTKVILANLYDHVISDGFIQVDDYGHWDGCKKAVKEFEASRNTCFKIFPIDGTGVWFKKTEL